MKFTKTLATTALVAATSCGQKMVAPAGTVGTAALKGAGIGLVASLAAGAAWCSTPWAS